jgi:hypothetical protein
LPRWPLVLSPFSCFSSSLPHVLRSPWAHRDHQWPVPVCVFWLEPQEFIVEVQEILSGLDLEINFMRKFMTKHSNCCTKPCR